MCVIGLQTQKKQQTCIQYHSSLLLFHACKKGEDWLVISIPSPAQICCSWVSSHLLVVFAKGPIVKLVFSFLFRVFLCFRDEFSPCTLHLLSGHPQYVAHTS